MKKWRCTVCGYVHEGPEPPDPCPVCGADKSLFEEITTGAAPAPAAQKPVPASSGNSERARWRCTVCGYIHTGAEPPDQCPVCGADKSLFEFIEDPGMAADGPPSSESVPAPAPAPDPRRVDLGPAPKEMPARLYHILIGQMLRHHAHPITVHFPNGVLPLSFLFIVLAMASGCKWLAIAAQVNLAFLALTMPLVLFTGYIEWQKRYKSARTNRFIAKIASAAIVAALSVVVTLWWLVSPQVLESPARYPFLFANLVMLAAAIVAGLIGGKLVFRD